MGITKVTQEFPSPIAPGRAFRALILESNTLIPKLLPQFIKSVDLLQGDGGVGSIEQVNFTEGKCSIVTFSSRMWTKRNYLLVLKQCR